MKYCITFVVIVNDRSVLNNNILSSPIFNDNISFEIFIQEGYDSAAKAYNDAINRAKNDLLVFAHQDIYFPGQWIDNLSYALSYLEIKDPRWGVLGCVGASRDGSGFGHLYSTGLGTIVGNKFSHPVQVQTLDEIVLIFRKSSGLKFDEDLPSYHLYGADICMNALDKNKKTYAISAFCIHNSNKNMYYPSEYFKCAFHVLKRWRKYVPIYTNCIQIDLLNLYKSKIKNHIKYYYYKKQKRKTRVENPADIILKLEKEGLI